MLIRSLIVTAAVGMPFACAAQAPRAPAPDGRTAAAGVPVVLPLPAQTLMRHPSIALGRGGAVVVGNTSRLRPITPSGAAMFSATGERLPLPESGTMLYPRAVGDGQVVHLVWLDTGAARPQGAEHTLRYATFDTAWSPPQIIVSGRSIGWSETDGGLALDVRGRPVVVVRVLSSNAYETVVASNPGSDAWEVRTVGPPWPQVVATAGAEGALVVGFLARPNTTPSFGLQAFSIESRDGGRTWNAPVPVGQPTRLAMSGLQITAAGSDVFLSWLEGETARLWRRPAAAGSEWEAYAPFVAPGDEILGVSLAAPAGCRQTAAGYITVLTREDDQLTTRLLEVVWRNQNALPHEQRRRDASRYATATAGDSGSVVVYTRTHDGAPQLVLERFRLC